MTPSLALRSEILMHARDFFPCWDAIAALQQDLGREDVLLNPLIFLTALDETKRSRCVACWRGEELIGVVYAVEHYVRGIRTGYALSGDFTGRGAVLCRPEDEAEVVRHAIHKLLSSGIHALHLRMLPTDTAVISERRLHVCALDGLIPGDRMKLPGTFEEFLGTLGKHTRRNVRYYTRKAEAEGIHFVACLSQREFQAAVDLLNKVSIFPADADRLAHDERLMTLYEGCERFALRAADGTFVAVLSGFPVGDRFHVLTQLNDVRLEQLSLSLVLRGFMVEHLIKAGYDTLQFMGGSSPGFGRFCMPQQYRSLFLDKRWGLVSILKRASGWWVKRQHRLGRHTADLLMVLASGFLNEEQLILRTAIKPAMTGPGQSLGTAAHKDSAETVFSSR